MQTKLLLLNQLSRLSRNLPLEMLVKLSGRRLLLPFYHIISDENVPHIKHLYPVRNTKLFRQDLDYLLKHFKPISLEDLFKSIRNKNEIKSNSFFLSFDDGLRENYDVIAPILKEKGIPAAFFINPDFVDNKELFFRYKTSLLIDHFQKNTSLNSGIINKLSEIWPETDISEKTVKKMLLSINYSDKNKLDKIAEIVGLDFKEYLQRQKPYLTTTQIKQLAKDGFSIGAHSMDHPLYKDLTLHAQLQQTKESVHFVQENYYPKLRSFAFPFTDFGVEADYFETVYHSKNSILDISFGTAGIKIEKDFPYHLQRLPMEGTLKPASELISTEYLYYLLKKPLGKKFIKR